MHQVSNLIDVIEDIEEDPDAAQILSTYEGESIMCDIRQSRATELVLQMLAELTNSLGPFVRPASVLARLNWKRAMLLGKRRLPLLEEYKEYPLDERMTIVHHVCISKGRPNC